MAKIKGSADMFYNHIQKSNDRIGKLVSFAFGMFVTICVGSGVGYAIAQTTHNTLAGILIGCLILCIPFIILGIWHFIDEMK